MTRANRLLLVSLPLAYAIRAPDGPSQQCADDAGPPWSDDNDEFGKNGRYHDNTPGTPILNADGSCPDPLKKACETKPAKAAFLDSQNNGQVGVGQSSETDALNVLDYEEFKECVARCAVNKYSAVKQMTQGMCVEAMIQNMIGEKTEEDVMRARVRLPPPLGALRPRMR